MVKEERELVWELLMVAEKSGKVILIVLICRGVPIAFSRGRGFIAGIMGGTIRWVVDEQQSRIAWEARNCDMPEKCLRSRRYGG